MQQAVFAAIAAVVLMTGCPARNERPTARPAPVPTALPKDAVPVKGPPDALRARLEGAYTLGVDRRFLRAFDEVQRMARGAACAEQTAATRVEKGWTIAVCGRASGPCRWIRTSRTLSRCWMRMRPGSGARMP